MLQTEYSYKTLGFRKAHPAGDHWIDWYDGRDATEVMDGFHSHKARAMYERLPKTKPDTAAKLEASVPSDTPTQIAFRKLFYELERDGWWNRDLNHERKLLGIWGGLVAAAALTARSIPMLAVTCLSLSMTAAGWLGHDYIHGIDKFSDRMRHFAGYAAGLLPVWWSDKHNKHHAVSTYSKLSIGALFFWIEHLQCDLVTNGDGHLTSFVFLCFKLS